MMERSEQQEPLAADARMTQDQWEGVALQLSESLRIAVNHKGNRYSLQRRIYDGGEPIWINGAMYASLTKLRKASGKALDGVDLSSLPEKPADAIPDFHAMAKAAIEAWAARDTRSHEYAWTLQTFERMNTSSWLDPELGQDLSWPETWLRVIIEPDDQSVMVQYSMGGESWMPVVRAETATDLARQIRNGTAKMYFGALRFFRIHEDYAQSLKEIMDEGALVRLLDDLPADIGKLDLPDMPPRPQPRLAPRARRALH